MQNTSDDMYDSRERRRYKRTHVLFPGQLISGDRIVDGVVLDVSANGAGMQLPKPVKFRSAITLRLARSIDFPVELIWDKENFLGLRFREAPARVAAILAGVLPQEALAT